LRKSPTAQGRIQQRSTTENTEFKLTKPCNFFLNFKTEEKSHKSLVGTQKLR